MSTLLYKQGPDFTDSTGSFLNSAPVEISTVKGYHDFIAKQKKYDNIQTIFNDNKSEGYVLRDSEVIANITGDARDYLLELAGSV
ncbi:hypothetical protein Kpol_1065p38 [Vanderwaltozyma polyspora DSM 70294]|uniref:Uncharacterized protein n=1 Tax=Vanderwaltozyma polyspora (strain ATCC 22028 / DSM 70294 / BCRC 21397 / CBS 2163 / NBRC 10782 / NRRL Y-8283 / UCD 57-17) TaxID=436907 RepID=A7TL59_VANPO|nr:uncharacterized protein Kpol_1065p38 [Vanderwaltozyma polyspora DSM 70294]EDO17022.1 hypothetical protein Kpol_1065p38 [Vanderwaltozyma polyspora DSM 70294]